MRRSSLQPRRTLREVFGPGVAYVGTPAPGAWLSRERLRLARMTASQLPMAGDLPTECCESLLAPEALALLRQLWPAMATDLRPHRDETERVAVLRSLASEGWRLAVQHVLPPEEVDGSAYLVGSKLLSELNDKARLADLVPAEALPPRRVAERAELPSVATRFGYPVYLKASTPESNGGGTAVRFCRDERELARAAAELAAARALVVEARVEHEHCWCVNALVLYDGSVELLGGAQQVFTADGHFFGNDLDPALPACPAALEVVEGIAKRAGARGYCGMLGVDLGERADGGITVFDLNFRTNSCTLMLQAAGGLRALGPYLRCQLWRSDEGKPRVLDRVERLVARGDFVPYQIQDPRRIGLDEAPRVSGFLAARDRQELAEKLRELAGDFGLFDP